MSDTFLNIPVRGDKITGADKEDQYPLERFAPILQALLDDQRVRGIRFTAYTPYFNDGDPCVFRVNDPGFALVIDGKKIEDDDYEDGKYPDIYSLADVVGRSSYHYDKETRKYVDDGYDGPDQAFYESLKAFSDALTEGHFDDVLLDAFGDHAQVTITRDGIDIEFWEHD